MMWSHEWQRHREDAAAARIALGPDIAALKLHDAFRDRKPKASAANLARQPRIYPVEAPEYPAQMFRRDAYAAIRHADYEHCVFSMQGDTNHTPTWRVFDRIL